MARAIGIDLGTTNSCAAVIENGEPHVLTYADGNKTIPSVFAIDKSGKRLIGEEARAQNLANPINTVAASKRLIGRSYDSKAVESMQQVFTYEIVEGNDSEVLIKVADQVLTLEQISAAILGRIKENAERVLGDKVTEAVITVPAYFNDRQRHAVSVAGKLAGLRVLRVLNEPTAAALAYGLGRKLDERVAIYDLGGGTFDISIIDIRDRKFDVLATGGDTFLGGVDFDDRVMQYLLKDALMTYDVDLSYDRHAIARIRDAAENAKIALSSADTYDISLPGIGTDLAGEPINLDLTLTREKLEELTGDLVERSIETCERILHDVGAERDNLAELLLVGGQSRMPLVRKRLTEFLGRPPSEKVHPDEAVAIGAAIMAQSLQGKGTDSDITLRDALPIPIGVARPDGRMAVLFRKNSPLPAKSVRTLTTSKENQKTIALNIYQGEDDLCDNNELLGSFVFFGLRDGPKGEVRLEVTFHIDSQGILNLEARDKDTAETINCRIQLDGKKSNAPSRRKKRPEPTKGPELTMPAAAAGTVAAGDELGLPPVPKEPEFIDSGIEEVEPEADATDAGADIHNLRSQLRKPQAPPPTDSQGNGVKGWFRNLWGGRR